MSTGGPSRLRQSQLTLQSAGALDYSVPTEYVRFAVGRSKLLATLRLA